MTRAAILSTDRLPRFLGEGHPTEEGLFGEDDILIAALAEHGITGERVPWRRKGVDWSAYDLAILRSTWDYIEDLPRFFDVLKAVAASCRLVNPLATVRWNYDKRYLAELERAGVRIVPSRFLSRGDLVDSGLLALPADFSPDGLIVKPTVGVGAFETTRVADPAAWTASEAPALSGESYLVQPFLPAIMVDGEWSFVFLDGTLAYTARKVPTHGDWRVQVMYGAETHAVEPAPADRKAAEAVVAALPVDAFYARIDMVRMADGGLVLMEAELIEPQLYFADIPVAAPAFARAASCFSSAAD